MADIDVNGLVQRAAVEYAVEDFDSSMGTLESRMDMAIQSAAAEGMQFWSEEAGRVLNTTRHRYQQALYIYEDFSGESGTVIGLGAEDKLVVAIEEGAGPFDLKPGFLKGRNKAVIPIGNPRVARTVTDESTGWIHPGWVALNLVVETDKQLDDVIVPKYLQELFGSL